MLLVINSFGTDLSRAQCGREVSQVAGSHSADEDKFLDFRTFFFFFFNRVEDEVRGGSLSDPHPLTG
jgi:hypothetical protein